MSQSSTVNAAESNVAIGMVITTLYLVGSIYAALHLSGIAVWFFVLIAILQATSLTVLIVGRVIVFVMKALIKKG